MMTYSDPYSDCIGGIYEALIDEDGPFISEEQLRYGPPLDAENARDVLAVMLTQPGRTPSALICDAGSRYGGLPAGGDAVNEEWYITVLYGVRAPSGADDWMMSYVGDEGKYYGEFQIRLWILQRLSGNLFGSNGHMFRLEPRERRLVPIDKGARNMLAYALDFSAHYVHENVPLPNDEPEG